jgi:hypothetical protein
MSLIITWWQLLFVLGSVILSFMTAGFLNPLVLPGTTL